MTTETERQRDKLIAILDQLLAPEAWSERFTFRPVPWEGRTVHVARSLQLVSDIEGWTAQFMEVIDSIDKDPDMHPTDFGYALSILRNTPNAKVARRGWNGPGQFIQLQVPDVNSKMTKPYLFITTVQGDRVPWLASQTDILGQDWEEVIEVEAAPMTFKPSY